MPVRTLILTNLPTPQRTPTLDCLAVDVGDLSVLYMHNRPAAQGWGSLPIRHAADYWDQMRVAERLAFLGQLFALDKRSSVVSMGYTGLPRVAALLVSRVRGYRLILRSDTNQTAIERQTWWRRRVKRLVLKCLIPRSATAWTIGTENERFWRDEVALRSCVRIPYETPVLPGYVSAKEITPRLSDAAALCFLFIGRLVEAKRPQDALLAFRCAGGDRPNWRLTFVGDGPLRAELEALADGDERVTFEGSVTYRDLGDLLAASDALLLPSEYEPWGLVVNEALGYGLRVIASDQVGAAIDLLDGTNGETFAVKNVDAMAACIERVAHFLVRVPVGPGTDTSVLMLRDLVEGHSRT